MNNLSNENINNENNFNSNTDIYRNPIETTKSKELKNDDKADKNNYIIQNNSEKEKYNNLYKNFLFSPISIVILSIIIIIIILWFKLSFKEDDNENDFHSFKDVKSSKMANEEEDEEIIIGIDFGTINSCFSYCIGKDISKIINSKNFLSEIELSRDTKEGQKHSLTSSISLMNYQKKELDNIIFIKGFKSYFSLENSDNINEDNKGYIYPYDNQIDKNIIVKQYFKLLKKEILEEISKSKKYIRNKDIKWIFAIPSTWNQLQKQIIKNATIESEMYNINFIHESEALSLSMYYDKFIPNELKKKDKIFMIVDAGGYSVDISIYEIIDKYGAMKELKCENSYNLGILNIMDKIIKIIEQIFGKYYIDKVKKDNPGEWLRTLIDINKAIEHTYSVNGIEIFEINAKFGQKENYYDYILDKKEGKKYRINYNRLNIVFPAELIGKIILENVNLITNKIDNIIKDIKTKKIYLKNIIVTGGFSNNKIFKNKLEEYYNKKYQIEYLTSIDNAISKGAVIYGIYPQQIKSIKSPVTLAIEKNIKNGNDKIDILFKKEDDIKNFSMTKIISTNKSQEDLKINVFISNENLENLENPEKYNFAGKIILKLDKKNTGNIKLIITFNSILSFFAYYENGDDIIGHLELEI